MHHMLHKEIKTILFKKYYKKIEKLYSVNYIREISKI